MNTRCRNSLQSMKTSEKKEKVREETLCKRMMNAEKANTSRLVANRERKMTLQQDVDELKKRLRHEENVHRALERAFTRPLGALPRLPPYLPPDTLELVAEVAVLEEEVVRLEEKVVHFRQGLYQEAIYISSSKKNMEMDNSADLNPQQPKSWCTVRNSPAMCEKRNLPSLSVERWGSENQCSSNLLKMKQQSPYRNGRMVTTPVKRPPSECKHSDCPNFQLEDHVKVSRKSSEEKDISNQEEMPTVNDCPNKVSENILKCLMNIFLRMSSKKSTSTADSLSSPSTLKASDIFASTESKDPYGICSNFGKRDIGPYKHFFAIEASSINLNQKTKSVFLIQRLKLLLQKLATVELKGLMHHEKIAFWINIYNSCMMKAYLEYGIPESPEMVITLMQKATVNVGGHILNAITIEHFILRLPYHSKYTFSNGLKSDGMTARSLFGLELSEPLVTFALSCGSWSSPAVRVYTASQVDNELETAKRDFLQAAIGISKELNVIAIPKLLDWYLLDFAKDMDSLLDWICLQLPCELGKEAMQCLERGKDEPVLQSLEILPYEFNFRYLMLT